MSRKRVDRDEFIRRANLFHTNFYDYSKVQFKKLIDKVLITCPTHGEFEQKAETHIAKSRPAGCPECGKERQKTKLGMTTEQFIERAKAVHGERFNYSKTKYSTATSKVAIECREHGVFFQRPDSHLEGRTGCKECQGIEITERQTLTTEDFIRKAREVHGDKYNYSRVNYTRADAKVTIVCPTHGSFEQEAMGHLQWGCKQCGRDITKEKLSVKPEDFLKRAKEKHGVKFSYPDLDELLDKGIAKVICRTHGTFYQRWDTHLAGHGCPQCLESAGELKVRKYLESKGIGYEPEKRFPDCKDKLPLPYDFYLPEHNILIEYDGEQHFRAVDFDGTGMRVAEQQFEVQKQHDLIKNNFAKENNIRLLRISYLDFDKIDLLLKENL